MIERRRFLVGALTGGAVLALPGAVRAAARPLDPVFDTHAHLITPDRKTYPPAPLNGTIRESDFDDPVTGDRLVKLMAETGVVRACAVQRAFVYGYDNSYILDSARAFPDRILPVIVVDANDPATPTKLRELSVKQRISGIRFSATRPDEVNLGWLNSAAAMRTWRAAAELNISVAVIFFRAHLAFGLPALARIARTFPSLSIVIDHAGAPHPSTFEYDWATRMGHSNEMPGPPNFGVESGIAAIAQQKNVYFKVTPINFDMLTLAKLSHAGFVARLAAVVGPDKMMWGSDIGQTRGAYQPRVADIRAAVAPLPGRARAAILHDTAARVYATR